MKRSKATAGAAPAPEAKKRRKKKKEKFPQYCDDQSPPDFRALAEAVPAFAEFVVERRDGRATVDFGNAAAVRSLTCAILQTRFSLTMELPPDVLVPTVGCRANYIRALADLLGAASGQRRLRGLDIGTGASCIYPLLGARMMGWRFVATDCCERSLALARHNVELNGLAADIELRKAPDAAHIFAGVVRPDDRFDFSMCNPPFFGDTNEACQNPKQACTAAAHEAVTPGGEQTFVGQMARESAAMPYTCRWWTSMLGRKASIKPIRALLKTMRVPLVRVCELVQGRTTRWVICWSFGNGEQEQQAQPLVQSSTSLLIVHQEVEKKGPLA